MNFWVGVSRKDPKNPELVQLHQESYLIQQKQGDGPPTKSLILPSSVLHHIRKYSRPKACDSYTFLKI